MKKLSFDVPSHKQEHLKAMAAEQGTSLSRLLDELTTQALIQFDAETRFKIRTERGSNRLERGLELLRMAQAQ